MTRKKKYELTEEHRAQLKPWAEKWIANALRTGPYTEEETGRARVAIRGLYAAAKLTPPPEHREVFCASPISGAIAAGVAAGVWWLRENPDKHLGVFGRTVSEAEIMGAVAPTCAHVVSHGMAASRGEPTPKEVVSPTATSAATLDATYAATSAATLDATAAATRDATDAATRDATDAATHAATDAATHAATRAATSAATSAATRAATDAATHAATDAATDAATRAATRAATDAAIHAATYAATRAATFNATRAATLDATRAATYAATLDATADATYAATDAATAAATAAATRDVVGFLVRCVNGSLNLRDGGNQWSGWSSYLSFFRHVAKLDLPEYASFDHYEQAAHFGPRFVHARFWIVSELPTHIRRDGENRPHAEKEPFTKWRDGWSLYYWHGVQVPAAWIEHPESLDPHVALTWPNIEQRRAAAEIIGWNRVLEAVSAKVVDTDADPMIGELLEADLPDAPGQKFLRVTCGTGRRFCLPVPPETKTALEGNCWTYGVEVNLEQFRSYEART